MKKASFLVRTDGVLGVGGVVGCLGGAPLGERGGALGGRVLVAGGEGPEDEEERRRHGSRAFAGMLASVNCAVCDVFCGFWGLPAFIPFVLSKAF
jgi:hypothetical protein